MQLSLPGENTTPPPLSSNYSSSLFITAFFRVAPQEQVSSLKSSLAAKLLAATVPLSGCNWSGSELAANQRPQLLEFLCLQPSRASGSDCFNLLVEKDGEEKYKKNANYLSSKFISGPIMKSSDGAALICPITFTYHN